MTTIAIKPQQAAQTSDVEQVDNQDGRNLWQQQPALRTRQQCIVDIDHSATYLLIGDSLMKGIYSHLMAPSVNEKVCIYILYLGQTLVDWYLHFTNVTLVLIIEN